MAYIKITETESLIQPQFDEIENAVLVYGLGYGIKSQIPEGFEEISDGVYIPKDDLHKDLKIETHLYDTRDNLYALCWVWEESDGEEWDTHYRLLYPLPRIIKNGVVTKSFGINNPITEPTIFQNLAEFRKDRNWLLSRGVVVDKGSFVDRSLYVTNDCLINGLPVLFVPVDEYLSQDSECFTSEGYYDYFNQVDEDKIAHAIYAALKKPEGEEIRDSKYFDIADKINCPVKFITTSGYSVGDEIIHWQGGDEEENYKVPKITSRILTDIGDRLDVVVLSDIYHTQYLDENDNVIWKDEDPFKQLPIKPCDVQNLNYNFNIKLGWDVYGNPTELTEQSSIVACTYPWATYTTYLNNYMIHMPGSYGQLMAFANMIKNNSNWLAAAGTKRGVIPNIIKPDYQVNEAYQRLWQSATDETGNRLMSFYVNPIMELGSYGMVIFGNRTCYQTISEVTQPNTFKKFLSIRLLLTEIHKRIHRVSLTHTFEPNDDILWLSYKQSINELLDQMISGRGLEYYRWYKIKTNKLGQLKAQLVIRPIETVEEFIINIHMTDNTIEVLEGGEE